MPGAARSLLEADDPAYAAGDPYSSGDPYKSTSAYEIIEDDPPPYGVPSHTMNWSGEDDVHHLTFTVGGDTAYILGIYRGRALQGSEMLRQFRAGPARGLRVKAVGAAPGTEGFWNKMQERGLIDEWTDEYPESFFEVDEALEGEAPTPPRKVDKGFLLDLMGQDPDNNLYYRLLKIFQSRKRRYIKLANNTWGDLEGELSDPGVIHITFHETKIITIQPDGTAAYRNGGWWSRTTMDRLNRWTSGGWRIYSHRGVWFWWNINDPNYEDTARLPFTNGDQIFAGGLLNAQAPPVPRRRRRRQPPVEESGKAGVYADLTGPKPQYYAKCPECGHVHGMYPSLEAAKAKLVCGTCQFERVMKYKSDLEKFGRPKKKKVE